MSNILDHIQENPDSLLSIKYEGILDKATQKLLNFTTTPEQKLMLTSGNRLSEKEYHSMYGLTPYIIKLTDGDSSQLFDTNGNLLSIETRHYSAVPDQQIDTSDKMEDVAASKTKMEAQMPYYRAITGKENPTKEDILNVYNWSIIEAYRRFTDPNNYMLDPYDASRKYNAEAYQTSDGKTINIKDTPIKVYGRKLGEGHYGRPLMEYFVETAPGKGLFNVTESMSRDPYINAGYKVTSNTDTYANRAKYVYNTLATREKSAEQYNFNWSVYNNVAASIFKLWHQWNANYLSSNDPASEELKSLFYAEIGNNLKGAAYEPERIAALREHTLFSDPEISDAVNGVSYRLREAQEAAQERQHKYTRLLQEDWAKFDVPKIIKHWSQGTWEIRDIWASSFADSAIYTFVPLALSSLAMPVSAVTKGGVILKWALRFMLDTAVMTQMSIQDDVAEFKKNNGYAPSQKKYSEMWINQFIANAPESLGELLLFKFAGGGIAKGLKQMKVGIGAALNKSQIDAYSRLMRRLGMAKQGISVDPKRIIAYNILKGAGIALGTPVAAGLAEGPGQESWQEWYQTFVSKYNSRNEAKYGQMNQWDFYNAVYGENNEELWQASTTGGGTGFFMGATLGIAGAAVRGVKTAKLGDVKNIVSNAKYVRNLFKLDQLTKEVNKPTPEEQKALDDFDQKASNVVITDQDAYSVVSDKVDKFIQDRDDLAGLIPDSNRRRNATTKAREIVEAIQRSPNLSQNQKNELILRISRNAQQTQQRTNSNHKNEPTSFFNEEDILQLLDDTVRDVRPVDESHVAVFNSEDNKASIEAIKAMLRATGMSEEQVEEAVNKRINEAVQINEEEKAQLTDISSNEVTAELRRNVREQVKEELGRKTETHAQTLRDVDEGTVDRNGTDANNARHFFKYMPQTLLNKLSAYAKVLEILTDTSSNHVTRARQAYDRGPKGSNNKGHTLEFTRPIIKANGGNNAAVKTMRNIIEEAKKLNELAHTLIDPQTGKTFIDDNEYNKRKEQINQFEKQINSNVALITGGKYARKANTEINTQEQTSESKEQTVQEEDKGRVRQKPETKEQKTVTEDITEQKSNFNLIETIKESFKKLIAHTKDPSTGELIKSKYNASSVEDYYYEEIEGENKLIDPEIGKHFDAHGIVKGTLADQLNTLLNILIKGFDKTKTLYTAPFYTLEGSEAFGTATNGAYKHGIATLVSKYNGSLEENGIAVVFINDMFESLIPLFRKAFPTIRFEKISDNKTVLTELANQQQQQVTEEKTEKEKRLTELYSSNEEKTENIQQQQQLTKEEEKQLEKDILEDLQSIDTLLKNSDVSFDNLSYILRSGVFAENIMNLSYDLSYNIRKYGLDKTKQLIQNSNLPDEVKDRIINTTMPTVLLTARDSPATVLSNLVKRAYIDKERQKDLDKILKHGREYLKDIQEAILQKVKNKQLISEKLLNDLESLYQQIQEVFSSLVYIERLLASNPEVADSLPINFKEELQTRMNDFAKLQNDAKEALSLSRSANSRIQEKQQNKIDSVDDLTQDLPGLNPDNTSENEGSTATSEATSKDLDITPSSKGRGDYNSNSTLNRELQKAIENLEVARQIVASEAALQRTSFYKTILKTVHFLEEELVAIKENLLHNQWTIKFNPLLNSDLDNWANALANSFNQMMQSTYGKENATNSLEDFAEAISDNPTLALLFDINEDPKTKVISFKFKKIPAVLVACAMIEFVCNPQYNVIFKPDPNNANEVKAAFGIQNFGSDLSAAELADIAIQQNGGISSYVVHSKLGALIMAHLGYTIKEDTAEYQYYNKLCSCLGMFAVNYLKEYKLPVIGGSTIESPIFEENAKFINGKSVRLIKLKEEYLEHVFYSFYRKTNILEREVAKSRNHSVNIIFDTETASTPTSILSGSITPDNQTPIQIHAKKIVKDKNDPNKPAKTDEITIYLQYDKNTHEIVPTIDGDRNPMLDIYAAQKNKEDLNTGLTKFFKWLLADKDAVLIGHNIDEFDKQMLLKVAEKAGVSKKLIHKVNVLPTIDTLKISKSTRIGANVHRQVVIAEEFGFDFGDASAHDAEVDVRANEFIFNKFVELNDTGNPIYGESIHYTKSDANMLRSMWLNDIKPNAKLSEKYYGFYNNKNKQNYEHNPEHYVRNTGHFIEYTDDMNKALDALFNEEYFLSDPEIIEFLTEENPDNPNQAEENITALKKALGYIDEKSEDYKKQTKERRRSISGTNTSIAFEVMGLLKLSQLAKSDENAALYLSRYFGKNGRVYIDGVEINPQSFKRLQRFLIRSKKNIGTYSKEKFNDKSSTTYKQFIFAVAQTFDLTKKMLSEDKNGNIIDNPKLYDIADKLLTLSIKQLKELYREALIEKNLTNAQLKHSYFDTYNQKVDNRGQYLALLSFLIRKQESSTDSFKASLPVELDSANSGISIKFLQLMPSSILELLGPALGFISKKLDKEHENVPKSMHMLRSIKGELIRRSTSKITSQQSNIDKVLTDAYSACIEDFLNKLTDNGKTITEKGLDDFITNVLNDNAVIKDITIRKITENTNSKTSHKLIKLYFAAFGIKPGANIEEVSGALRNLFKTPIMTFMYSAGLNSINKKLGSEIWEDFLNTYTEYYYAKKPSTYKDSLKDEQKAIIDFMELFGETYFKNSKTMHKALMAVTSSELNVNITNKVLDIKIKEMFISYTYATFSKTMVDLMNHKFKEFKWFNDFMGIVSGYAYRAFNTAYKNLVQKLSDDNQGRIPLTELRKGILNLKNVYPTLAPVIDGYVSTLFFANRGFSQDYRKLQDKTPIRNKYYMDDTGNPVVEESFIEELEWLSPEQAGKVVGIHNIDAFQAMFVQNMMPSITCIFDAFVVDVQRADKVARQYNKGMFLFNMFYNMPLEYFKLFEKSLRIMSEQWYDNEEKEGRKPNRTNSEKVNFENWIRMQNVKDPFDAIVKREDGRDYSLHDFYTESFKIIEKLEADKRKYFGSFENGKFIDNGSLLRIQNLDGVDDAGYSVIKLKNFLAKHPKITSYTSLKEYFTSIVKGERPKEEFGNDPIFGSGTYIEQDDISERDPNTKLDKDSLEARLALLNRLANEESNPDIDGDYLQEIKELWEASDVLAFLGTDVITINNGISNSGSYHSEQGIIKLHRVNAAKYKNRPDYKAFSLHRLFQMSLAEIFAHETLHSITVYALKYGPERLYRQVGFLWETAKIELNKIKDPVTGKDAPWRAFLPTNYDTLTKEQKAVAEEIAVERYNYVFKLNSVANRTDDDIRRLGEFITYGLSNPALRKVFKGMNYKKVQNLSFFEKLKQAIINIFEVVFKHKPISEAFRNVQDIINGTKPTFLEYNMYNDLAELVNKLSRYNANAKQELNLRNPLKVLSMVLNGLFTIPAWMDKKASKLLLNLNELDPEWVMKQLSNGTFVLAYRNGQKLRAALSYVKGAGTMLFSNDARAAILEALRTRCDWAQNCFALTWLREVTEADPATKYIHTFNAARAELEEQAKNIEAVVYKTISDSFRSVLGRDLQLGEQQALYRIALRGDLQCLLTKYSLDDIVKLIKDPNAIDIAMAEEKQIWGKNLQDKVYAPIVHFIETQAQALAKFQEDGTGHLGQMYNASNILQTTRNLGANGTSLSYAVEEENALNRYITLEFLKNRVNAVDKQAILDITKDGTNNKGLQEFLKVHQKYVEDSKGPGSVVTSNHIVKGYTHNIFDGSGEVLIASADTATQTDLEKKGYTLLYIAHTSGEDADKLSNIGVYKAPFPINKKISNSAFTMAGVDPIYLNLDYDSYSNYLTEYSKTNITEEDYYKRMRALQEKRKAAVRKFFDPNFTIKDVEKESGDFLVRSSVDAISASSFVFTINEKTALDIGKNTNGSRILANMCGSFVRKSESGAHNQVIVQYLQEYFEQYADQDNPVYVNGIPTYKVRRDNPTYVDPRTGKTKIKYSRADNMKFVLLTNKQTINGVVNPNYDPQIGEMWNKLPISLRDLANRQQIWIRADWVPDLLGVESTSIVEWSKLKNWNQTNQIFGKEVKTAYLVKQGLFLLEQVLKLVTHTAKNNIVFRMPRVLLVNVLSNIALSTLTYSNPFKVMKYQFEAFQDLSAYVTAEEEYKVLQYKYDLNGYLTEAEKDRLRRTEATMKKSKLYPLMQANLFGNITRDLESINKDDTMYLQKALTNKIPVNKIPTFVKRLAMEAQMAQGTFAYETMYKLTQYSDFIARAAEYYMATDEKLELRDEKGNKIVRRDKEGKETFAYIQYKEKLIEYLRDKFVNYELPLHKKEQYLNDLGLLMFTKFRKRIQWVLMHGIIEHPITALWLFALGNYLSYSVTPVHDVFPINTGLQVWHSPITNFENAITLGGFHMLGIHPLNWI